MIQEVSELFILNNFPFLVKFPWSALLSFPLFIAQCNVHCKQKVSTTTKKLTILKQWDGIILSKNSGISHFYSVAICLRQSDFCQNLSLACKMVKMEGTLHFECILNDFLLWGDLFVRFFTVNQTQLQGNLLLQEVAIY